MPVFVKIQKHEINKRNFRFITNLNLRISLRNIILMNAYLFNIISWNKEWQVWVMSCKQRKLKLSIFSYSVFPKKNFLRRFQLHIHKYNEGFTQIAILTCSKFAAVLLCKPANLQQVQHDKSASSWQDCSKLTQTPKSPYAQLVADLSCKLYSCCIKFAANLLQTIRMFYQICCKFDANS